MARCKLYIEHPKFVKSIGGDKADPNLIAGLKSLRDKVDKDYTRGWFPQQMKGYPQYQKKVWKWDFAPEGATSATRPGWRLFAYVPDPNAPEPIPATVFHVYSKSNTAGYNHKQIADMLKAFLASTVAVPVREERFRRQIDGDGTVIGLCYLCFEKYTSADHSEMDILEETHECPAAVPT